ncbi:MAG: glycosyltransferase family 39 protein [Candidatus Acidiferrum sp.]
MPDLLNSTPIQQDAVSRGQRVIEAGGVALLFFAAFALRAWGFSQIGITHFDEGVYTLSGFWPFHQVQGSALYPWQKLFSPPGYFGLIGIVNWIVGKPVDGNAIAINLALGSATVLLVFRAGNRFFGAPAGVSAATLVALSEFHIALSRTALTDTGFSFFFLAALALTAISFEKESPLWAIAAGLAIGAAWNFKYHGWLLVAFAFVVMCMEAARKPASLGRARILFRCWTVIVAVSAACFFPWMLYVQYRLGGYAAIEDFHLRFANFLWIHNFRELAEMQRYFDGWISRISPAVAFLCGAVYSHRRMSSAMFRWTVAIEFFGLLLAGAVFTGFGACLLLAGLAVPTAWRTKSVFARLLLCALLVLFVLTPCYTPYARLMLPWSLMVMLFAGFGIQQLLGEGRRSLAWEKLATGKPWKRAALTACLVGAAAVALWIFQRPAPRTWMATTSARDDAAEMVRRMPANSTVFVVAEPEAAFYFKQAGLRTFCINGIAYRGERLPHPFLYQGSAPVFVVGGFYGRAQWDWDPVMKNRKDQFRLVSRLSFQPGDMRLLDDFAPENALVVRAETDHKYDLLLYQFLPEKKNASKTKGAS